jgi:hypothetical protein
MSFQAIVTKYLGPTNVRGARIKATADAGSITLSWDHALNPERNHRAAAMALAEKYGWQGRFVGGGMPDNTGNVYVRDDIAFDDDSFIIARSE